MHNNEDRTQLGKMLRAARLRAELTTSELADKLGWQVHAFYGYETGNSAPSIFRLAALADFYRIPVEAFLGRGEEGHRLLEIAAYVPDPGRNVIRVEGENAYLLLTNAVGETQMEVMIDIEDIDRIQAFTGRWTRQWSRTSKTWYVVGNLPHSVHSGEKKAAPIKLHRFLLDAPASLLVDHKDGNGLNNRRENLRLVTKAQNAQNLLPAEWQSKSGLRGIQHVQHGEHHYWRVIVRVDGKPMQRHFPHTSEGLEEARLVSIALRRLHMPYSNDPATEEEIAAGMKLLERKRFHTRRGERSPHVKLTEAQVSEIRRLYAAGGITHRELGKRYGVDRSTITAIFSGKNWQTKM